VDFLNLDLELMHQDIAPRNLLIDPETYNILLFDLDWAACGQKRLLDG
jgi:Ser/Thr protein kinase RdoA (MazF antagonist)